MKEEVEEGLAKSYLGKGSVQSSEKRDACDVIIYTRQEIAFHRSHVDPSHFLMEPCGVPERETFSPQGSTRQRELCTNEGIKAVWPQFYLKK
jgi:hypothetical protein